MNSVAFVKKSAAGKKRQEAGKKTKLSEKTCLRMNA